MRSSFCAGVENLRDKAANRNMLTPLDPEADAAVGDIILLVMDCGGRAYILRIWLPRNKTRSVQSMFTERPKQ
jgi:hypothetical protein